jgi:hypothetical protein
MWQKMMAPAGHRSQGATARPPVRLYRAPQQGRNSTPPRASTERCSQGVTVRPRAPLQSAATPSGLKGPPAASGEALAPNREAPYQEAQEAPPRSPKKLKLPKKH